MEKRPSYLTPRLDLASNRPHSVDVVPRILPTSEVRPAVTLIMKRLKDEIFSQVILIGVEMEPLARHVIP